MSQSPQAIVGPDMVVGGEILAGRAVLVDDGSITAVIPRGEIPSGYRECDVGRGTLCPGFIDIHTHGAGGHGFDEADAAAYRSALQIQAAAGVTTVLPTLATASLPAMTAAIDAFRQFRDELGEAGVEPGAQPGHSSVDAVLPFLPRSPGLHLEGPYFAPAQRGAQDLSALRRPDDGSAPILLEHADVIRMVSFAPELPGAVELTRMLVAAGIIAAAGHSDGRDQDLRACQREGLSHVIHIFSGQSTTVRRGPWREPGMLEATLASDDLTVEMIADGKHLPVMLMQLAVRCLAGRLCVVSDATPGAGLPDGERYRLGSQSYVVESGVGMTLDRTAFAGSTTLIPAMLPTLVHDVDVPLPQAVAMLTSIPAAAARLSSLGEIAAGYAADFVLLDSRLQPVSVAIGGVWRANHEPRSGQDRRRGDGPGSPAERSSR